MGSGIRGDVQGVAMFLGVDVQGHEPAERAFDVLGCGSAVAQRVTHRGEVRFRCLNADSLRFGQLGDALVTVAHQRYMPFGIVAR